MCCSGNAKSQLEAVIEHLAGRQRQSRGAQVHAVHLSDRKGCSQDSPLPRPHLMVCSGGKAILLEIPAYLRPSKSKQIFFSFAFVPSAVVSDQILTCCSLGLCYSAIIAAFSIAFAHDQKTMLEMM